MYGESSGSGWGAFVLGIGFGGGSSSGSISTQREYIFYVKNDDGGFVQSSLPATTPLYEQSPNPQEGYIVFTSHREWNGEACGQTSSEKKMIVPRGTIIREFKV